MLPAVTLLPAALRFRPFAKAAMTAVVALSLALPAEPALALGKNERNVLKGIAGTLLLGAIIQDANRRGHRPQPQPYPVRPYPQPYPQPVYPQPYPVQPVYPRPQPQPGWQQSIYSTPTAQAFRAYGSRDRVRLQQHLAARGYYRGGIDGAFGPGTYNAIVAYANDRGEGRLLGSVAGVYQVLGTLSY